MNQIEWILKEHLLYLQQYLPEDQVSKHCGMQHLMSVIKLLFRRIVMLQKNDIHALSLASLTWFGENITQDLKLACDMFF